MFISDPPVEMKEWFIFVCFRCGLCWFVHLLSILFTLLSLSLSLFPGLAGSVYPLLQADFLVIA